jgi:hypothetical protein
MKATTMHEAMKVAIKTKVIVRCEMRRQQQGTRCEGSNKCKGMRHEGNGKRKRQ